MDNVEPFFLSGVEIFPAKNQLVKGDQEVTVQPRVMALLQYLAQHHSRVVSTEELIEKLWDGRVVSYGTVPKCITSLRKAVNELLPGEDVVANYSKKGYQLLLTPNFASPADNPPVEQIKTETSTQGHSAIRIHFGRGAKVATVALTAMVVLLVGVFLSNDSITRDHKTQFAQSVGFTNEIGLERIAEPHPDGNHFAYIRDDYKKNTQESFISSLIFRSGNGEEWVVDETDASWFKLAWSEDQKSLLAVEVKRSNGQPLTKDYFDIADYYYGIYVLKLDLANKKVVDKSLVANWQGRLLSATWVNASNIELVARQGVLAENKRYRIDLASENNHTVELDVLPNTSEPIASSIYRGFQAVAYKRGQDIQVTIYNQENTVVSEKAWEANIVNMSWIPDGSGVLLHFDYKYLNTLYVNGESKTIELNRNKDRLNYNPRFSANGKKLYVTEKRFKEDLSNTDLKGNITKITQNDTFNYLPSFSSDGKKIIYVSVRNDQAQIWIIEGDKERKLVSTEADTITSLIWNRDDSGFIYKADDEIFLYQFAGEKQEVQTSELILSDAKNIRPLSWSGEDDSLMALLFYGDQSNLWKINPLNKTRKQLTFGAIGGAIADKDDVYFQYKNKPGLWRVKDAQEAVLVSEAFPSNSKLLSVTENTLYFVSGGSCRESEVKSFDLAQGGVSSVLLRESSFTTTSSFHPLRGTLEIPCYVPESNIIEYH